MEVLTIKCYYLKILQSLHNFISTLVTPEELDVHFVKYHPERLMAPPDALQIPLFCLLCPKVYPEWALAQHIKSEHWGRSVILGTFSNQQMSLRLCHFCKFGVT